MRAVNRHILLNEYGDKKRNGRKLVCSKHVLLNIITCNEFLRIYKLLLLLKKYGDPPILFQI